MGIPLNEMMARLPGDRRRRVEARAAELIAEEMSLRDLRKAMGRTQVAVAAKLGLKQENISRVEKRADMLLSTLDGYLRAIGGHLRLVVEFENRAPVWLSGLTDIDPETTRRAARATTTKHKASKGTKTYAARTGRRGTSVRRHTAPAGRSAPKS
jgi:transcriptional regulator with XRE-family HTH domain